MFIKATFGNEFVLGLCICSHELAKVLSSWKFKSNIYL